MKSLKISLLISILAFGAMILCGCDSNIDFNRESAFEEFKNSAFGMNNEVEKKTDKKASYTSSNGVIIYKAKEASSSGINVNFGPSDINFNIDR